MSIRSNAFRWSFVAVAWIMGTVAQAESSFGVTYAPLGGGIVDVYAFVPVWDVPVDLPVVVGARVDVASSFPIDGWPSVSAGAGAVASVTELVALRAGAGAVLGWGRSAAEIVPFVTWNAWAALLVDVAEDVALVVEGAGTPSLGAYGFSVGVEVRR